MSRITILISLKGRLTRFTIPSRDTAPPMSESPLVHFARRFLFDKCQRFNCIRVQFGSSKPLESAWHGWNHTQLLVHIEELVLGSVAFRLSRSRRFYPPECLILGWVWTLFSFTYPMALPLDMLLWVIAREGRSRQLDDKQPLTASFGKYHVIRRHQMVPPFHVFLSFDYKPVPPKRDYRAPPWP